MCVRIGCDMRMRTVKQAQQSEWCISLCIDRPCVSRRTRWTSEQMYADRVQAVTLQTLQCSLADHDALYNTIATFLQWWVLKQSSRLLLSDDTFSTPPLSCCWCHAGVEMESTQRQTVSRPRSRFLFCDYAGIVEHIIEWLASA